MASKAQEHEGCSGTLLALDAVIQALNIAKDACGILPAQAAFSSVVALLTMVRVRVSLLRNDELLPHICPGDCIQRERLR